MNTIAERIRFAMNVRNVKQVEMVQRTGITKGAFSSYLSGNYNPKKDKLELIADALDININWLMGEMCLWKISVLQIIRLRDMYFTKKWNTY